MSQESFQVGDMVRVCLSGRAFVGKVHQLLPNYNWSGDPWMEVRGDDPDPFITIVRCANAERAK